jgi:uncharacterized protein (TIGR00369 family)
MGTHKENSGIMSSKEQLEWIKKDFKGSFMDGIGFELEEYKENHCRGFMIITKHLFNSEGILHGGIPYIMADTAAGVAAFSFRDRRKVVTVSGTIHYLKAVFKEGKLLVDADVLEKNEDVATVKTEVFDEDGTVYAIVSFTLAYVN